MTTWCFTLYLGISFFLVIHLSNMLIAIMGESFTKNNEIKESKKRVQQLSFVVDNWWIDPIPNKQNIVYIVGAFSIDIEDDEQEQFNKINEKIDKLTSVHSTEIS